MAEGNVITLMEKGFGFIAAATVAELFFDSTVVVSIDFNESRAAHGVNETHGIFAKKSVPLNFRQA